MFLSFTQVIFAVLFILTASTRCSSQNSRRRTTNGTTGPPRVTASECVLHPWLGTWTRAVAGGKGISVFWCSLCSSLLEKLGTVPGFFILGYSALKLVNVLSVSLFLFLILVP